MENVKTLFSGKLLWSNEERSLKQSKADPSRISTCIHLILIVGDCVNIKQFAERRASISLHRQTN